jgi:predicted PurR-regulated permease PerM
LIPSKRDHPLPATPFPGLAVLGIAAVVVTGLYFARDILVPLALAILLSFALGPLVMRLRRLRCGRVPSVMITVLLAVLLTAAVGTLIGSQVSELADQLPQYQTNITGKIRAVRGLTAGGGIVGRAAAMLRSIGTESAGPPAPVVKPAVPAPAPLSRPTRETNALPAPAPPPSGQPAAAPAPRPVVVEVHQQAATPLEIVQNVVGPLLRPLATTGIVIVFVIFFLLQREDLRDRFIRLAGAGDLRRTTEALDDAISRLSRYLLMQLAINTVFGLLIGLGLWAIGIPQPVLWGVLAMLLRFVPYIGPIIAALFPMALALAIDPGWSLLAWTGGLFVIIEGGIGQAVEPYVYSRGTGLSPVAVVVAASFWTWLWGPEGLLLSTPLTLCLVVLGRHVARLEFLDVVLGDEPALRPEESFYQRILADDPDEAAHLAEIFLRERPLAAYYDEVAIRGLVLAQADTSSLGHVRRVQIKEAVDGLIDDLSDHALPPVPVTGGAADAVGDRETVGEVLCIAGRGSLDEAAAAMLAQLLAGEGVAARVVPSPSVSPAAMAALDITGVAMICLSYLEAEDFAKARYLVRRLRRKRPPTPIVVGYWTLGGQEAKRRDALGETGADAVVTSLAEACAHIAAAVRPADPAPADIAATAA